MKYCTLNQKLLQIWCIHRFTMSFSHENLGLQDQATGKEPAT